MKSSLTWHGMSDLSWLLFYAALALAAAALVVVLYRYERRLISRTLGWTLLTLRLCVIGVVFLALLEPVRISEIDREQTGRILLAVDVSGSMDTADSHATRAEKLRWARALGLVGNDQTRDRLDRWQEELDAGREPEWVDPAEVPDAGRRAQVAAARQQVLEDAFLQLETLTRRDIAARLITGGQIPLTDRLAQLGVLETSLFAGKSEAVEPAALKERLTKPDDAVVPDQTDLGRPVSPAAAADDVPIAGVVLLTDGRHNAPERESRLLARLGGLDAPVYPVLIGSEQRPRDLAFAVVDYPRQPVSKDDHPLVRASLRTAGFEGQDLTVVLEPLDGAPGESQSQTVRVKGPATDVQFTLDAKQVGRFRYALKTDVIPGETRDDNNERNVSITVVDDQADVLLVEGEGRWEFRFLDNALKRDEQVQVQEVLFRQPYMGILPETFFPRRLDVPAIPPSPLGRGAGGEGFDPADSPFSAFDCVIVGDVGAHQMPPGGWELLDRFVREEGGTLVLLAGRRHLPLGYPRHVILEGLLPVVGLKPLDLADRDQRKAPLERGFHLTPTADGAAETFLQFAINREENDRIWSELPGHTWGLIGRAKGEATVLASVLPPGTRPTLQAERDNAVIVQQQVGFGQVLWIGVDSTWRWRHRVGDEYHHRFWGQLVRWGARFKAFSKNEFVAFGPLQPTIEPGDEAVFKATWSREFLKRFPNVQARVVLSRIDDATRTPAVTIPLNPAAAPLEHEGRTVGLRPGDYRARLEVDNADLGTEKIEAELQVLEPTTSELSDISAHRDLLQAMADATGGRLFLPHELSELPDIFRTVSKSETLRSEQSLWDGWPLLILLFGLLTGEWVLRKVNGLP